MAVRELSMPVKTGDVLFPACSDAIPVNPPGESGIIKSQFVI